MSLNYKHYRHLLLPFYLLAGLATPFYAFAGDPTFTAAFSPSTIAPGVSSTLTFTIDNTSNDTALGDAAFSATLPTGVTVASSPDASTDCNSAQISATAGGSSLTFTDARIGTGTSCTFSLIVTSSTVGTHSLTTGNLASTAGTHSTANADLTVSASLPSFSMAASPTTVAPGGITTITYTIDNSLSGSNATFVDFTHSLPTDFSTATTVNFSHDCPLRTISGFLLGSVTVSEANNSITANDIEVNAGASCTLQWDIAVPDAVGEYHLETGSLASSAGTSGPASTLITVESSITTGSVLAMSFSEEASPGESVTVDFSLVNVDRDNDISDLNFTADLNAALSGLAATALPATGFCGSGSTISGSSTLSISNVSLASAGECDFSVTVLVPANAAAGDYTFTSSTINLTRGSATTSSAASATLRVRTAPLVTMQFLSSLAAPGEDVTMRFTVTNTDTSNTASDITFSVLSTDGLPGFVAKTFPSANYCGTGSTSSTTTESTGTVTGFTMSGASLAAGANCTFDVILTVPSNAQSGTYDFTSSSGSATVSGSSLGVGAATASLSIAAAPSLSFSVTQESALPGDTITLNFTLHYNENAAADATAVGFTVDLETPLTGLASTSGTQNDVCGSGSSISGTSTLTATGMSMSAGDTCSITVNALVPTSAGAGTVTITSSAVSATVSSSSVSSAAVSDDFVVSGLSFNHEFLTDPALPSSDVVVRYTITNDANASAATNIQFSHDLSAVISGLTVNGSLPSTPCNGSSTISGTTNLSFSSGELTPGTSCSFDVTLAIPASTDGIYTSVTSGGSATVDSANTAFSASNATLNVVPLTVLLSTSESSPTSSASIPLSISFSRDVVNFISSDLTVGNGSISNFAGSGSAYTATLNPTAGGTVTVDLPANAVDDSVDSTVKNPAATQLSIEYEASPAVPTPSLVIGSPSASDTNSGPITYGVTYTNGDQINLTSSTITLNTTGTATATVAVADGTTSTPTITLSSITGEGTLGVSIAAGTARNGDKTAGSAGPSTTFNVDNTAPGVTITSPSSVTNTAFTATFTFTEAVTGFTVSDISAGNANVSNFNASSGTVYTATITPTAEGAVTVDVAANAATDSAGNNNTAATQLSVTHDSVKPTVTISGDASVNAAFTATFTFSEAVSGFALGDISVSNGAASNFASTSSTIYTATITPTSEGQVTIDVAADSATDTATNGNTAASQFTVDYDLTRPTVTISAQGSTLQSTKTVTFTFSEDMSGFTIADISVGNGSAGTFNTLSASTYTAVVTANSDGLVTVDVNENLATDAAGNGNTAATQLTLTADNTPPTVAISGPSTPVNSAFTATFTFSEDVSGFAAADITSSNASLSNFSATSAKIYTATVTPASDGNLTLDVAANVASDIATNGNSAATQFSVVYDTTRPTVLISGAANVNAAFTATFTFSEAVTGFALNDILVGNGAASNFAASSATVYTATITPTVEGQVTIDVTANSAVDSAANGNTAASQFVADYDATSPTLALSSQNNIFQSTQVVTFTFSEDVTGFTASDITVNNGSAGTVTPQSPRIYSSLITATADGQVTVDVNANVVTDSAGNGNTAASQLILSADATAPTLSSSTPADNSHSVSTVADLTFQFSEAVSFHPTSTGTLQLVQLSETDAEVAATTLTLNSGSLTGQGTGTISGSILTINPSQNLLVGTRYAVKMSADLLQDAVGNPFGGISNITDVNFVTMPAVDLSVDKTQLLEETAQSTTVSVALQDANGQPFTSLGNVDIAISFSGSTATADSDYTVSGLTNDVLSIATGQSLATFTLTAINDSPLDDEPEQILVAVGSITTDNAIELQPQEATITIVANAVPVVTNIPTSITLSEDVKSNVDLSGIDVADADNDPVEMVLSVSDGKIKSPRGSFNNAVVATISPTSIKISGSVAAINGFLDNQNAIAIIPPLNSVVPLSLSVTVSDGIETSAPQSIPITITAVNDHPRLLSGSSATFDMTGGSVGSALTYTETEGDVTMTVTLDAGNLVISDLDTTGGTDGDALYSDSSDATSTVTVSFNRKVNLESLVYFFNVGSTPGDITLTPTGGPGQAVSLSSDSFTVDDVGANVQLTGWVSLTGFVISSTSGNFAPGLDSIVFSVPPDNFSFQEDVPASLSFSSLSLSDEDSTQLSLQISVNTGTLSLPANRPSVSTSSAVATVSVSLVDNVVTVTGTATEITSWLTDSDNVQYTPASDAEGSESATVTITVDDNDGSDAVTLQTIDIDITAVNDAPVIASLDGDSVSYVQAATATNIDSDADATVTDVDDSNFDGGSLTVTITSGGNSAEDLLSFDDTMVTLASDNAGADVSVDSVVIGTLDNAVSKGNDLVVSFNSNADASAVGTLLNAITYANSDISSPSSDNRVISVTVSDGEDSSESATVTVNFTPLDTDTSFTFSSTFTAITPDANSQSSAQTVAVIALSDSGTDGQVTSITGIDFAVSGSLDSSNMSFILRQVSNSTSATTATYIGSYSNGVLRFSDTIDIDNGSSDTSLYLETYFNNNEGLSENSDISFSITPTDDVTVTTTGSQIGTSTTQGAVTLTLSIEATKLVFSTEPDGSVSGQSLTTQPVVQATDSYGNLDVDFQDVVELSEFSAGSLTGNSVTAISGVASFTSVSYFATTDNESFLLSADVASSSSVSLNAATSNTVSSDVNATRLVFVTEPSPVSLNSGVTIQFSTVPVVNAVDAQGLLDEDFNADVVLSETNGPGSAIFEGTGDLDTSNTSVTLASSAGVVAFSGLEVTYNVAGQGNETFNLLASSGSLSTGTSTDISVNDLPTLEGAPDEIIVVEDEVSSLDLSSLTLSDTDGNSLQLTVSVTLGTLIAVNGDGESDGVTISGSESATIIASGSAADLLVFLNSPDAISYLSALNGDIDATLTIVANDGQADSGVSSISLSISPVNDAPTIEGNGTATLEQGEVYDFTPTSDDVDGDTLVFTIENKPDWLTFDADTGNLRGTADQTAVGIHEDILIVASDGEFDVSLETFTITVTDTNDAPTITGAPEASVLEDSTYSFTPTASDPDGDNLEFSIENQPPWSSFDTVTGSLTGVPGNADVGDYPGIVISVSDGTLSASLEAFTISVSNVNDAPQITGTPSALVSVGNQYSFQPVVTDIDSDTFTFSITGLPGWATFDELTGLLSGTPESADVGTYSNIIITVSDGELTADLEAFNIEVLRANEAPVISGTPDTEAFTRTLYSFTPVATDINGDALSFSVTNLPGWLNFDTQTGGLSGTPAVEDVGLYQNIVITVSDGELNGSLPAFSIEVVRVNLAPVAESQNVTLDEDSSINIQLTGTDEDGDELSYRIVQSVATGTLELNGSVATYVPPANESGYSEQFTFVVNDGVEDSQEALVTVEVIAVNDAPEISGEPGTSVKVLQPYSFTPSATDIDSDTLTFSIQNAPTWSTFDTETGALSGQPGVGDAGVYGNVTISVSDGELSAQLSPFNIEVLVNTPPVISGTPDVVAVTGAVYSFTPLVTDEDNDELTFSVTNQPAWSQFDAQSGMLSGTPGADDVGTYDAIEISVSDGVNTVSLPSFSIRVCEVCDNQPPAISGTAETSVVAGESYLFTPTATDANEDQLTFSVNNLPGWAAFDETTGSISGAPQESDVGLYSNIVIRVTDGENTVALAAFSIEVLSANTAPVISGSPADTVFQGELYQFTPVASDADGDTLVFSILNRPAWASFNPQTGRLRGTPSADDVGTFNNITIKVTDKVNEAVSLAAFAIEVVARNSVPQISGNPRTSISVGANYGFTPVATDADGDDLTFSISNQPGWLAFDSQSGRLSGSPTIDDVGLYNDINITVSDGEDTASLASFNIDVVSNNDAPVASDMNLSVNEDKTLTIVASAVDSNQDDITLSVGNSVANGTLIANDKGWTYTPNANFNGTDTFVYRASDGELESDDATVTIQVTAVNDKPVATDDSITLDQLESGIYLLDVLANDEDVDVTTNGDVISLQRASTNFGTVSIVNNQLQLDAGASFFGKVNLTYSIRDQASKNDTARVSLTINGVDSINAPVINVPEDITVDATGLFTRVDPGTATAFDAEGNPIPVSLVDEQVNFSPGTHTLYWQAEDSFGTVTTEGQQISVNPIISVATEDSVAEGTTTNIRFILNGEAPFYPYEVSYSVSGTAQGGGVDHSASSGTVVIAQGQESLVSVEVIVDSEIEPDETIEIAVNTDQNVGANGTATIIISEENIAPEALLVMSQNESQRTTVAQDEGNVSIEANVTDPNPQDTVTVEWTSAQIVNQSADETVFLFDPASVTPGVYTVSLYANDDGNPILDTTASISFEVVDSFNVLSDTEDTDGDLIPDAQEGYGDSDGDGIPDYLDAIDDCNVVAAQAENQTEFLIESDPDVCMRRGDTSTLSDSNGLQVVLEETGGRASKINRYGEKVELIANNLPEDRGFENSGGIYDFVIYDLPKIGDSVRIVIPQTTPIPENAVYRKFNADTERWFGFIQNDNNKVFSTEGERGNCPPPGAASWMSGLNAGSWCVQLLIEDGGPNDDDGAINGSISDPGGVSVFVSDNTAPVARNDAVQMSWNSQVEIAVLDNDSDADTDILSITRATANRGTVEIIADSTLLYTAKSGFSGSDTIRYIVSDGNGGNANASVTVTIRGNRAPGAVDDFAETDNVTSIVIDVLGNDIDVDGDSLTITSATATSGEVTINADNTLTYVPDFNFSGLDNIHYEIADPSGAVDSAVVSVFVDGNEMPIANNDSVSTAFGTSVTIDILANDSDPDGDEIMVLEASAARGSVVVNEDNSLTYTPDVGFSGIDTITYLISDGVLSASGSVSVTVQEQAIEVVEVRSSSGGSTSIFVLIYLLLMVVYRTREKLKYYN